MLMEQRNKGDHMNQNIHNSTTPAEEVLSEIISPQKKQELTEKLAKLKSTLDEVESRMVQESQTPKNKEIVLELDRRMQILRDIGSEVRSNISTVLQIQLTEKYPQVLQPMLQNLDKINSAHSLILDALTS